MTLNCDGMKMLITGGNGTLAQAIAEVFEASEMDVLAPNRSEMDVTSATEVEAFFKPLNDLELVVCNAGVIDDVTLGKMEESQWDRVLDVNLKGAFLTAKAAAKHFIKQRRGHILFISSFAAHAPAIGQANYAAAKAGVEGFAKSLAQELGARNVRVNTIVPGFMETKMTQGLPERVIEIAEGKHVLKRFNTPECVAQFILHLHQHLPHTSGQIFHLDSRIIT